MDFYAEAEKRKQKRLGEIGELAYRRQLAVKTIEDNQLLIEDMDIGIAEREAAISEIDHSQRDFNTYLAVKEGALTTEQLAEGIRAGSEGSSVGDQTPE